MQGQILRVEVENFKSYKGHQTIGPFLRFTSVIGPNGSGKSNISEALGFVLGCRASALRGRQMTDLIYNSESHTASRASVKLVLALGSDQEFDSGGEIEFQRVITSAGTTEYKLDGRNVTYKEYDERLKSFGLLAQARNFLVFQGYIESVAQKSPKELTALFEQISGSDEYKAEYTRLEDEARRCQEKTTISFTKKKGVAAEQKQYKEQQKEAERFTQLMDQRAALKAEYTLFQLYHIERRIAGQRKELAQLRKGLKEKENRIEIVERQWREEKKRPPHPAERSSSPPGARPEGRQGAA
ncbi:putative Structural maintenance of chromosomes protein 1 [Paratrimastix pyriformis]|uniref:Structural maintenance of chromosomes protein 1 n=1 Tax=Paratrimastix pyriformis TaxID=342808 RepID=A0ABQ8UC62_9EUKA|nr:putative Structural maintenance of chromosomes protein 1 [Paratrimastix pyriformis]